MSDWTVDPWIIKAVEMMEEFYDNHRTTMPEDPRDVWDENEITYFMFSFVLWSAKTKYKIMYGEKFLRRSNQYKENHCCPVNFFTSVITN